jgi:signal peptidase I
MRHRSHLQAGRKPTSIVISAMLLGCGLGACGGSGQAGSKSGQAGSVASAADTQGTPSTSIGASPATIATGATGAAAAEKTGSTNGAANAAGRGTAENSSSALRAGAGGNGRGGGAGGAGSGNATHGTGRTPRQAKHTNRDHKPASAVVGSTGVGASSSIQGSAGAGGSSSGQAGGVPYLVSTNSMLPTYKPQSTVYYDPTRTHPAVGDVIVFYYPVGVKDGSCGNNPQPQQACEDPALGLTQQLGIKRVVGLPGDTIAIRDGHVIRNGQAAGEPDTLACGTGPGCEYQRPLTVPAGHYYVLSDNRALYFQDSRVWGSLPQEAVIGAVVDG